MYPFLRIGAFAAIPLYNLFMGIGFAAGALLFYRELNRATLAKEVKDHIALSMAFAILGGFAGAFGFDWAAHGRFGGMTFFGGMLGGAAVFVVSLAAMKAPFGEAFMVATPALTVAHAFGRIGCFLGGCCFGKPSKFLGVVFPTGSPAANVYGYGTPVLPTQLIESAFLFGLTVVLLAKPFRRVRLPVYLASYGLFRFFIEFLRGDDRGHFAGLPLSPSQCVCVLAVAASVFLFIRAFDNPVKNP